MNNRRRNHPYNMIKNVYGYIKQLIVPIIIVVFTNLKEMTAVYITIGVAAVSLFSIVMAYFSWRNYVFYVEDNVLWVEKGVFTKSKQGISLDKISTVNVNQSLIERAIKLVTLKIDSGSSTKGNEVKLLMKKEDSENFRALFTFQSETQPKQEINNESDKKDSYRVSSKELLIYALTSNSLVAGLVFITSVMQFAQDIPIVNRFLESSLGKRIDRMIPDSLSGLNFGEILIVVLIIISMYLIVSFFISIIAAFVKYYNFTVLREKKDIVISYGLFEKKKFVIPINKIKAMYIHYGLLGQFFSLSSIKIESIGYGDEKGEVAILYPVANALKKECIITDLLPEFNISGRYIKPPKRALKSFIINSTVVPFVLSIVATVIIDEGYLAFLITLLFVGFGFLAYRNCAILRTSKHIVITHGFISKKIVILPIESIQATTLRQNFIQKRSGLINLDYSYQSNIFGRSAGVRYMDFEGMGDFVL